MRIRATQNNRRPRHAAAATELVLLLPFLALIFFVAVDYARVFHYTQVLQSSADAGARYASGHASPPPYSPGSTSNSLGLDDLEILSLELASDSDTPTTTKTQRTYAAKKAAVTEGSTLNPPLKTDQIAVSYDNTKATVRVSYNFHTLTPFFGEGRNVTLERTVVMELAPHLTQ